VIMYLQHFGLREAPFSLTPDTGFFFAWRSHQEALNVLRIALDNGEGFLKITGDVGLGKTLLCRKLLNSLAEPWVTAWIPNPHLAPGAMRQAILDELGVRVSARASQNDVVRELTQRLLEMAREGRRVVLVIDEAQQLPDRTLEAIRLLTNLETEKRKLLQVVMFGQPELDQRLAQPSLRQLRQRVTFSHELESLDRDGVREYVQHRLRLAGRTEPLFSTASLALLARASRGVPRLVNVLAHKALLAAYGEGMDEVRRRHVALAVRDTEDTRRSRFPAWQLLAASLAGSGLLAAGLHIPGGLLG